MSEHLTSPEAQFEAQLDLRGHHVFSMYAFIRDYRDHPNKYIKDENGNVVDPDRFYLFPDKVKGMITSWNVRGIDANMNLLSLASDDQETRDDIEDYLGKDAKAAPAYKDQMQKIYEALFLSEPSTPLTIRTGPDAICRACQISPSGQPGRHCLEHISEDTYFVRAVQLVRRYHQVFKGIKAIPQVRVGVEEKTVTIPLGLLRNYEFLDQVIDVSTAMEVGAMVGPYIKWHVGQRLRRNRDEDFEEI
jgi:hypothetical protein